MRSNFQQIVSYCVGLRPQNPGLREVDFKPSPKRGSDKINMQKQGRNTQKKASRIVQPGLTQHLQKKVELLKQIMKRMQQRKKGQGRVEVRQ